MMGQEAKRETCNDPFGARLTAAGGSLTPAARKVLRYIEQNRLAALAGSAAEIAAGSGTSDATVIRAVQALGFNGLGDLRQALVASLGRSSTPADDMRRTLADAGETAARTIALVLDTHRESIEALHAPAARERITVAVATLHPCPRIVVFGIGPSAHLARYVVALLRRCGRRSCTLDATGMALADQLLDLQPKDGLLVLAYGRAYREVEAVFAEARRLGLSLVLVTDSLESRLAQSADVIVPARRGRGEHVALHGATLVGLEALVLGLAAANRTAAMASLERLNELRLAVIGQHRDKLP